MSTPNYSIYTGFWTNWSYGKVFGSTLTLERSDANLLIAFVAFSLTIIATRVWVILCFAFHLSWSSSLEPRDTIHHQRQTTLRNSPGPIGTAWTLFQIAWAWRKNRGAHALQKLALPIVCCILLAIGFAASAGFSSRISVGSEVLLSSENCRTMEGSDLLHLFIGVNITIPQLKIYSSVVQPWRLRHIALATNYAQQCYSNNSSPRSDCRNSIFIQSKLPLPKINRTAACPFDKRICVSDDSNLLVDNILDSHIHYGINAPPQERHQFRHVLHCGPLVTQGYKELFRSAANQSYVNYFYGHGGGYDGKAPTHQYRDPGDMRKELNNASLSLGGWLRQYTLMSAITLLSTYLPWLPW